MVEKLQNYINKWVDITYQQDKSINTFEIVTTKVISIEKDTNTVTTQDGIIEIETIINVCDPNKYVLKHILENKIQALVKKYAQLEQSYHGETIYSREIECKIDNYEQELARLGI